MNTDELMRELKTQGVTGRAYRLALQRHKEAREIAQAEEERQLFAIAQERVRRRAEAKQRAEQIAANEAAIKAITQPTDAIGEAIRAKIEEAQRIPRGEKAP
jgi:hypothetical protein